MKNPFINFFKKKPTKAILEQAHDAAKNVLVKEFGNDIKISFSISEANPKTDILNGKCESVYMEKDEVHHFIHFKKS